MSERAKFEILCVTMNQHDFSKIKEMNIHSNVVFANQCDHTSYEELVFDEVHTARMVSTETRGVGVNRNIALMYGDAEFCLFADDDVQYIDKLESIVIQEFENHPKADIIVFNLYTDSALRKQKMNKKTRRVRIFDPMPWGAVRIAIRLSSVRKNNIWFSTLFGGGCIFPSGEDSMWLLESKKKGLRMYLSRENIGTISFADSTWFKGYDEQYYFGKGAYYQAVHSKTILFWELYICVRTKKRSNLSFFEMMEWLKKGENSYIYLAPYSSEN